MSADDTKDAAPAGPGFSEGLGPLQRWGVKHVPGGQSWFEAMPDGYWTPWHLADAELRLLRARYDELLMAVGNKNPGESRHDTALRYIRNAEATAEAAASSAAPDYPFCGTGSGLTQCDMHDDESH